MCADLMGPTSHSTKTTFFDPKIDVIFRALFTSPKWGKECLLSFINSSLMHENALPVSEDSGTHNEYHHEMIVDVEITDGSLFPEGPKWSVEG